MGLMFLFLASLVGAAIGGGIAALWYGLSLLGVLTPPSEPEVQGVVIVATVITAALSGGLLLFAVIKG